MHIARGYFAAERRSLRLGHHRWGILLAMCFGVGAGQARVEERPIDCTPALVVDDVPVSRYLVDKYYHRFAIDFQREHDRPPSPADDADWLRQFIAQQVLIAHARTLGYAERPEVREMVERMAQNVLCQEDGPLYRILLELQPPVSREDLDRERRWWVAPGEVIIAHFPDRNTAGRWLDGEFAASSREVGQKRLEEAAAQGTAELRMGLQRWPFFPFVDLAEIVPALPPRQWRIIDRAGAGVFAIYIRNPPPVPATADSLADPPFAANARLVRMQVMVRARKLAILRAVGFAFDRDTAGQFLDQLAKQSTREGIIDADELGSAGTMVLARYRIHGSDHEISGREFVGRFDALFVRHVPGSADEVGEQAADFVVNEMDLRASRTQRLDKSPQFVEDRAGFAGFQILDAFEKEVVKPGIVIGDAEVKAFRNQHQDLAFAVDRVRGRKLTFGSVKEAADARAGLNEGRSSLALGLAVNGEAAFPIEIARGAVPIDLLPLGSRLFTVADGTVLGPVATTSQQWLLFIKDADLENRPLTTVEFAQKVRPILEKRALEHEERVLAEKWEAEMRVKRLIDASALSSGVGGQDLTGPVPGKWPRKGADGAKLADKPVGPNVN